MVNTQRERERRVLVPSYEIVDWVAVVLVHTQIVASVDNSHTHTHTHTHILSY